MLPLQWRNRSTFLDVYRLLFFRHCRTVWTVKDRMNGDSFVKSIMEHCCLVHVTWRRAQAGQSVRLACVRQGRSAGCLERRHASWSRLRIVWSLTMTLLAVRSCVLKALAVSVLSLRDVRTTKRSCCLVLARGRREMCSEFKQFARALLFLFCFLVLSDSALPARCSQNVVRFYVTLAFFLPSSGPCFV